MRPPGTQRHLYVRAGGGGGSAWARRPTYPRPLTTCTTLPVASRYGRTARARQSTSVESNFRVTRGPVDRGRSLRRSAPPVHRRPSHPGSCSGERRRRPTSGEKLVAPSERDARFKPSVPRSHEGGRGSIVSSSSSLPDGRATCTRPARLPTVEPPSNHISLMFPTPQMHVHVAFDPRRRSRSGA